MRILVVIALLAAFARITVAAEPVSLRFRFAPGEQTTYKLTIAGAGLSKIMNQSQSLQVTGEWLLTQKTLAVDPQGNGQLETTPSAAKLAFTIRGQDELQTLPTQPVAEPISPLGKLLAGAGAEGPPAGLTWAGLPGLRKLLGSVQLPLLPERAVTPGLEWSDKLSLEVGGKKVTVEQKSTLESFVKIAGRECAQIKTQLTVPVEVNIPPNPLGMSETMKGTQRVSRMTLFDPAAGRVVRQETVLAFLLDVQIIMPTEGGKQVIPGQLELRLRVVAEVQP